MRVFDKIEFYLFCKGWIRRISPGMVRHAMCLTKLGLFRHGFFSNSGKAACPLAQLVVASRIISGETKPDRPFYCSFQVSSRFAQITLEYLQAFMDGVDHADANFIPSNSQYISRQGFIDGQKVWRRLQRRER